MSSVTTLQPSVKRPRSEEDVTTLPTSVKRLKLENTIACPNVKANLYDEVAGEDTGDEEDSAEETPGGSEWDSSSETSLDPEWGSAGGPEPTTSQWTMSIAPLDEEYFDPDGHWMAGSETESEYREENEQILDEEEVEELIEHERNVREERKTLLEKLHATASVGGLEKMESLNLGGATDRPTTTVPQKEEIPDSDAESDSEDWSKPDAAGWGSAADGSRLLPEAIELMLDFFENRQHVSRAECEAFCLQAYLELEVDGGADASKQRPLNIHAYPSECQFRDSYMVEIIDTAVANPALMTQFYITPQRLDEDQLARAKEAYGRFVPEYTYVGHMGLAPTHPEELFVWRIVSPAGRPFAADADRLGLRVNQGKYIGILKDFVDFVCESLRPAGGGGGGGGGGSDHLINVKDWPTVLHNPRLDKYNIIVRRDWSGIACVMLWGAPPVTTLPFGASLSGLLCLEGKVHVDTEDENPHYDRTPSCEAYRLFKGYSREACELQRLWMKYLQEKDPALANDPRPWHRLFEAMAQGVATAAGSDDLDTECYERQVDHLTWDWFYFEMNPCVPVENAVVFARTAIGRGEEDGVVDGDMDMDMDMVLDMN